jgi:dTDP-4-amino-4,6-dideoxygalactose transaminase
MENITSGLMSPAQAQALNDAIDKAVTNPDYLSSISGGGPVEQFEEEFAQTVGARYALALSSCTAALHVALMVYGVGSGDEVIVSPYTWGQSVSPVLFTGATPVFADIDASTCTIDPNSISVRISPRTKAIIPVHIFGIPADMDSICTLARTHGLAVISDAAQAFGALSKGRKLGGLGDVACYSLGRGKAVCGGEGGVMVTNNRKVYEQAILFSQHPLRVFREKSDSGNTINDELNWNYRIHPFAAVLALVDLKIANKRVKHRQTVSKTVSLGLSGNSNLEVLGHYSGDNPSAYGIPLTFPNHRTLSREAFIVKCQTKNIYMRLGPIHTPIHLRPKIKNLNKQSANSLRVVLNSYNCPVALNRCSDQELVLFDAVTVDSMSIQSVKLVINKLITIL